MSLGCPSLAIMTTSRHVILALPRIAEMENKNLLSLEDGPDEVVTIT